MDSKLGVKLSPILSEIEDTLLEHQVMVQSPIEFTDAGFRASIKIAIDAILDKMWALQEAEKIDFDTRLAMADACGKDMRALVKKYTNIDTFDLYKF